MPLSTLDSHRVQNDSAVCPHCGQLRRTRRVLALRSILDTALRVLAVLALALVLVPPSLFIWKLCVHFLADGDSHPILYHPLEDWTHY
jgi:hypothetical protein